MNIVIMDKKDAFVRVENKTLRIDDQKIPLHLIDTLILNSFITLSASQIIKIAKADVTILFLSSNGVDSAVVTSTRTKSAELKSSQYKASVKDDLKIAKNLLSKKITTHAHHLKVHDIQIQYKEVLEKIKEAKKLETLLGIEGSFSKLYFTEYFSLVPKNMHKGRRTKRPPLDPANALLSFFYSLFYNLITIRLLSFGFEPSIGFLHKPFRSHNALSSDILELFRADVNEFVLNIIKEKKIQKSDFTKRNGVYLRYEGRKKLWSDYKELSHKLIRKIDLELADIRSLL